MDKKAKIKIISVIMIVVLLIFLYFLMKNKWDINLVARDILGLFGKMS